MWKIKKLGRRHIEIMYFVDTEAKPNNLGKSKISRLYAVQYDDKDAGSKGKLCDFDREKGGWVKKTGDFELQAEITLLVRQNM